MAGGYSLLQKKPKRSSPGWRGRSPGAWSNYPLFSRIDPFLAGIREEERFQNSWSASSVSGKISKPNSLIRGHTSILSEGGC